MTHQPSLNEDRTDVARTAADDLIDQPKIAPITGHLYPGHDGSDDLFVSRIGEAGSGGAFHRYEIVNFNAHDNPEAQPGDPDDCIVMFQNGPVVHGQRNGVTIEALLAVIQDRLMAFQNGPFACEENGRALHGVNKALMALHDRTLGRKARGVEGREVA